MGAGFPVVQRAVALVEGLGLARRGAGAVVRGGGVGAPPNDVQPPGPSLDPEKDMSHKYSNK